MRAVIYSRFSTDRQADSSIADQERVCSEYAERACWTIVECYSDEGISGAAMANRPGVMRLREAAFAKRFDTLLVTDLSRLSRSNGQLSTLVDQLVFRGIRVIGVQDGYDSSRKGHELQVGLSGIIGQAFRSMIKDRTYSAMESRAKTQRPTGGRAYGYANDQEAAIVREIFQRAADGESCGAIAVSLNRRAVPSPGSLWEGRSERRCNGWMGSPIRSLLGNARYTGEIIWNKSEWTKDPDSGKRVRRERPRSEWITYQDESQRIVSDELFERVQVRFRPMPDATQLRSGRGAKYLLSGLLRCDRCEAHYVLAGAHSYECSNHRDGATCDNGIRVRRDHAEAVLLDPIRNELLSPARISRMVVEMEAYYSEQLRLRAAKATDAPKELRELEARIARLRERLRAGDPDLTADELQGAIERAEAKRTELLQALPDAKVSYKLLAKLPQAAALYRSQIMEGLDGDPRAALKARVILRELFGGQIRLQPQKGGGLIAHWDLNPGALIRPAIAMNSKAVVTGLSGSPLWAVPTVAQSARLR